MSHAANLRNHYHSAPLPAKRRKLSDNSTRPKIDGINGLLDHQPNHRLAAHSTQDAKSLKQRRTDDSAAKITHGTGDAHMTGASNGVIDISSAESESESDSSDEDDALPEVEDEEKAPATNGVLGKHDDQYSADTSHNQEPHTVAGSNERDKEEHAEPAEEPSFGDLLRERVVEHIDVSAVDQDAAPTSAAGSTTNQPGTLQIPSASSLGTVLTQALRSNDTPLLESCLQVPNLQSIRATIERLPSVHAATLLQRLAERMHKRPSRSGSLMVWVQWTVVAHGGYLASQPVAMAQLKELYRVVKMRAAGLQPLLALKGKLDMLEAQMQLRRNRTGGVGSSRGQEEDVIYVEGEESDEDADMDAPPNAAESGKRPQTSEATGLPAFDDSEDDGAMPLTNGVSATASVAEDDDALSDEVDSDDEDEDLIDDEAESTNNDSDAQVSDDEIKFDEDEDISDSEEESRPGKRSKSGKH